MQQIFREELLYTHKHKTNYVYVTRGSEHITELLVLLQCDRDTDMKQKLGVAPWRLYYGRSQHSDSS